MQFREGKDAFSNIWNASFAGNSILNEIRIVKLSIAPASILAQFL